MPRALLRVAGAALALIAAGCWDDGPGADAREPLRVSMEDPPAKLIGDSAWLWGEIECRDCADDSGWTYGNSCPDFDCPPIEGTVWWTNRATGATAPAIHGPAAACHCDTWLGASYCYTSCSHVWSASVPLAYGGNDVVVSATAPGYAQGSESALIERVPATPAWLAPLAGSGEVTLAWTPSEGATSYNLYWSTTAHDRSSLCTKIAGVSLPYAHTGLAGGVPHYYFVTALAGAAEGFDSERLAVTPQ